MSGPVLPGKCARVERERRAEVTDDVRFTGGRLVETSRPDLFRWLNEYGIPS